MKQAIRENRRGKVRVADEMILDRHPGIALLRSRMEVCEETHDLYTRSVWFIGYAPEFDVLELGQRPPEYGAIFTCDDDGRPLGVLFHRRADEGGRIEEFKEASAAVTQVFLASGTTCTVPNNWKDAANTIEIMARRRRPLLS